LFVFRGKEGKETVSISSFRSFVFTSSFSSIEPQLPLFVHFLLSDRWLRDSCANELEAEKASTDGVQRISLCPLMPSLVTLSTRQISDSTSRLAYSQGSQSTSRWPKTQGFVSSLRSKVPAFYSAASLRSRRNGERLSRFACIAESPTAVDDGRLSVSEIWVRRERGKTRH